MEQASNRQQDRIMSQMQLFYHTALRPYLEPFYDITHNTGPKIAAAVLYTLSLFTNFALELFETPEIWWKGLAVLVVLDFLAGTFRAITDSKIEFNMKKWGRTAYKIPAYIIAGLGVGAGANMFPIALGWLQYVTFAILSGLEIWSIFRNLKLVELIIILTEVVGKKYNIDNMEELKEKINKASHERYKEHEKRTYLKNQQFAGGDDE